MKIWSHILKVQKYFKKHRLIIGPTLLFMHLLVEGELCQNTLPKNECRKAKVLWKKNLWYSKSLSIITFGNNKCKLGLQSAFISRSHAGFFSQKANFCLFYQIDLRLLRPPWVKSEHQHPLAWWGPTWQSWEWPLLELRWCVLRHQLFIEISLNQKSKNGKRKVTKKPKSTERSTIFRSKTA